MKTKISLIIFNLSAVLVFILGSCTKDSSNSDPAGYDNLLSVSSDGTTLLARSGLGTLLTEDLTFSDSELEILLHMKEEEKLARDVYLYLYEKWKLQIFSNIAVAEDNHMNAVILLLQNYGEEYTAVGDKGLFSNPDFQVLYEGLIAKGSETIESSLEIGALIEEMDIKDLGDYLGFVSNENIIMVFENLQKGSRNHLRAFNRQLESLGLVYTPVYISREEYDQIVSTPNETGSGLSGNHRGKQYKGGW